MKNITTQHEANYNTILEIPTIITISASLESTKEENTEEHFDEYLNHQRLRKSRDEKKGTHTIM